MRKTRLLGACCAFLTFGLLTTVAAQATELTFDIDDIGNGSAMPQNYGDNVVAADMGGFHYGDAGGFTPNIVISYADPFGNDITHWRTGFNDLIGVLNNEDDGEAGYSITLTADAGYAVSLLGFDMGNYASEVILPGLTIADGDDNILFSQVNFVVPNSSEPHLDFDFNNISAQEISINVDTTGLGGNSDNIGLDNIQFSQAAVVPVPAAMWLFGSGLIGLLRISGKVSIRG
jgi:hypothetical protein